ncbi:hypothetical protein M3Y98_00196900 [Aphelenchoides besseyi]|nr:hypothetical protein M3Y98_00196900 [Aphelenchoides besseyi]KAI6200262.1 hypothetical protein M3Y96_00714700 [Aphelenchoides besseyi]
MADSTNSGESDSGEKMSTTDSHNWSEEDSDSGSESDDEENDDEFSITDTRDEAKMRRKRSSRRKRTHQSDTETRNLLDDIGGEEEFLDLEESKENSKIDVRFFEMSEEQLVDYYTKCFLYLQRKTVGQPTISGAVNGADERVVEFFRKSRLDTKTLSKIWSLADVNEDGFLNHAEFLLAMHLIVLHVKGRVPVPSRIPSPVRPCLTPTRLPQYPFGVELQNSTASSTLSSAADNASTSRGSDPTQANLHFHQHSQPPNLQTVNSRLMPTSTLSADESNHKQQSLSDDHLHVHTKNQRDVVVTDFSDAPPVLVDNCPTALNVSTSSAGFSLLNSLANRGPPPLPPTRNYATGAAKGHGRSISLDLNTFAAVSGHRALPPHPSSAMFQSTTSGDNKFESSTASAEGYPQRVHENDASAGSVPNVGTSMVFQRLPTSHHYSASISSGTTTALVHPPLPPQRPTAGAFQLRPTTHHSTVQLTSTSTQTESSEFGENDHEDSLQTRGSNRLALLDEHTFAQLMQGAERMAPAERCNVLRRYNAELENERSTLAQICLQLQLRIDEAEAALKDPRLCGTLLDINGICVTNKQKH